MSKRPLPAIVSLCCLLLLGACRTYPDYTGDFRFPLMSGDVTRGQLAFMSMGCPQCHTVDGVDVTYPGTRPVTVNLGGDLVFAKTYGDLVTSIINPDHVISDRYLSQLPRAERRSIDSSPMYINPEMKVSELIDIVTFLNSRYRLLPGYTEYYY